MANVKYIDWADYTISISNSNLKEIVEQGIELTDLTEEALMNNAELTAQAEVRSYLRAVNDIDTEFAIDYDTQPDVRNKLTIQCVVNISLYCLHMTISPRDVPEKVEKAYERCIEMLDAARRGELDFGLDPAPEDDDSTVGWRVAGSNFKFTSQPFSDARIIEDAANAPVPPIIP